MNGANKDEMLGSKCDGPVKNLFTSFRSLSISSDFRFLPLNAALRSDLPHAAQNLTSNGFTGHAVLMILDLPARLFIKVHPCPSELAIVIQACWVESVL